MAYKLPVAAIDYLLYNYRHLRKEVELLTSRQSGVAKIPPKGGRPGSPVEITVMVRSDMEAILDAVEAGWRALSPDLREVATLRYRRNLGRQAVIKRCFLSEATYDRRLRAIRAVVAGHLAIVSDKILRAFWAERNPDKVDSVRVTR